MSDNRPSKRRTYTREFKLKVLGEIEAGKSQAQAAREYQLNETAIYKWRQQLVKYKEHAFAGQGKAYTDEARLHELERMVGRLTMENDFLKKLLKTFQKESRKTARNEKHLFMNWRRQKEKETPPPERPLRSPGEAVGLS